ncbi:helix-turn-helix domain-containing protein [Morganella morganii]|uniref:helix-turn-helix domain-containing protein n=1 Tax=Morganella morganii TaxID=582 RepID=UPI0021D22B47|nr:helix-turn-helix domain-containing protein [Morganella morganii]MCU6274033.1 helix-turn-helix domain-containing protein [Morganella morganii]
MLIEHVLSFIEKNLRDKITISDIVNLTGYSRRHIQFLFKQYTGLSLGSYIRQRKLCRSAVLLRLTGISIIDISVYLDFSSQTNFSREFKKHFSMTPNQYRKSQNWNLKKNRLPIDYNNYESLPPVPEFCFKNGITVFGYEVFYRDDIFSFSEKKKLSDLKLNIIRENIKLNNKDLFVISDFKKNKNMQSTLVDVRSIIAFEHNDIIKIKSQTNSYRHYEIPGGLYAKFNFKGKWSEFNFFSRRVYLGLFCMYGLSRRQCYDIEIFKHHSDIDNDQDGIVIECDYYVPIIRE